MGKYVEVAEKPKKKRKKGQSGKAQRKGDKQEHVSKRKKEEKATGNDSLNKKQNKVTKIYFFLVILLAPQCIKPAAMAFPSAWLFFFVSAYSLDSAR